MTAKVWNMDMDFLMSLISISKLRRFTTPGLPLTWCVTSISKLGLRGRKRERREMPEPKPLLVILVQITSLTAL